MTLIQFQSVAASIIRFVRSRIIVWSIAILLTGIGFGAFFNPEILIPTNISWINAGDLQQHYLGWSAFRQADSFGELWGTAPLLAYPHGTPISATDSNPLMSFLLWPIADFLPQDFQFIGVWYLLSLTLSLAFASAILRHVGFDRLTAVFLGAVMAFQPILFWRYGHDTLTAQWLVLGVIYVAIAIQNAPRAVAAHAGLLVLAILIHPYFFVMLNIVIGFDLLARAVRQGGVRFGVFERSALMLISAQVAAFMVGRKLGVFSLEQMYSSEIGAHTTDLLGFFNPFDASRVMPQLPAGDGQYEGFAYLGLGGLILLIVAAGLSVRGRSAKIPFAQYGALWAAAICAAILAVLPAMTVLGNPILTIGIEEDSAIHSVFAKLRSSGRFVWITVYVIVLTSLAMLPRTASVWMRPFALIILAIQFWDLGPLRERSLMDTASRDVQLNELQSAQWQKRIENAKYLYLSRALGLEFSLDAASVAIPANTPVSWFYTAQGLALPKQLAAEDQLRLQLLTGSYAQDALHLLDPAGELPLVHRNGQTSITTHDYGKFHALETTAYNAKINMDASSMPALAAGCVVACSMMIVVDGSDGKALGPGFTNWLKTRGGQGFDPRPGDGYAAVLRDGVIVDEAFKADADARLNVQLGEVSVSLRSSVEDPRIDSEIALNTVNFARSGSGVSVLVRKDNGQLTSARFEEDIDIGPNGVQEIEVLDQQEALLLATYEGPRSDGDDAFVVIGRVLSQESSLLDVMTQCRQDCMMAISVKDEATSSLPFAVRRLARQMGLTMADISYREGYSAILQDGIVLVQGLSKDEAVDVAEIVNDRRIRVKSAGFDAGSLSSITIDREELSLNQRGVNLVVMLEDGDTISYHFDTHGGF